MNILMLHNRYRLHGGEDVVAAAEARLLRDAGHAVDFRVRSNADTSRFETFRAVLCCAWSRSADREIRTCLRDRHYDVVHVHNFFPQWTPAVHAAAHRMGVPSVQTLHNYRLSCLNGLLFTRGRPCTRCLASPCFRPGLARRCYRNSAVGSSAVAAMLLFHRWRRTWQRDVSAFICPSEFVRDHFRAAGMAPHALQVIPHFVWPGDAPRSRDQRRGLIYVGRLSPEKGLERLIEAWAGMPPAGKPVLSLVGDGPLRDAIRRRTAHDATLRITGPLDAVATRQAIASSLALLLPSQCYETFGLTLAEAFAAGTPVVASDIGAIGARVVHAGGGAVFAARNATDLRQQLQALLADSNRWAACSRQARRYYEAHWTPSKHLSRLIQLYESVAAQPGPRGLQP